ncbi:phospholipase DDHD2-like [Panonychus citri]|uniref:phospholipase DDHD2-like n=1 Tax=Panonychus citri TaxID=50023 RepID=UPI002307A17D|nr:phospholipase DDHD2-like [Panonychus citri]
MTSTINSVHWFHRKTESTDDDWQPFSRFDSNRLEEAYQSTDEYKLSSNNYSNHNNQNSNDKTVNTGENIDKNKGNNEYIVSTNGGRYDVHLKSRCRRSIYWPEPDSLVLRATWFYRPGSRMSYKPFNEEAVTLLEKAYQESVQTGNWNQKIYLSSGDTVIFHNSKVFVHYEADHVPFTDDWSNITDNLTKPGKVWRGVHDLVFEEGEIDSIDHLVFVVHGIGEICDLRLRSLIEVVDDFRRLTNNLVKTHLAEEIKSPGRIEFIPISWHAALHGEKTGIDSRLNLITLNGIPKLRHFSNDTILDALFYTSPIYCQIIIDTVGNELNRVHELFIQRNPKFKGTVNLMGHSLGSLIIFDILSNQLSSSSTSINQQNANDTVNMEKMTSQSLEEIFTSIDLIEYIDLFKKEKIDTRTLVNLENKHLVELGLEMGPRVKLLKFIENQVKTQSDPDDPSKSIIFSKMKARIGQPNINYPLLSFNTKCFFALGSPVAAFLTVRGITNLSNDNFHLPTCGQVFNIFHPFDPIAYRLEPLIDENFQQISPCQIPHHKGRKRMHLELKENLIKMGSDLKEKVYNSLKPVWDSLYGLKRVRNITASTEDQSSSPSTSSSSIVNETLVKENQDERMDSQVNCENDPMETDDRENQNIDQTEMVDLSDQNHPCYKFNSSGRVDYVLQEAPIEFFNGYIFALATHTCYWQSEDTSLFVLKNVYKN